jgi:hypothetical protein
MFRGMFRGMFRQVQGVCIGVCFDFLLFSLFVWLLVLLLLADISVGRFWVLVDVFCLLLVLLACRAQCSNVQSSLASAAMCIHCFPKASIDHK